MNEETREIGDALLEIWRENTFSFPDEEALAIADTILNLGYHKTVWHKVSDKLPEKPAYYYCHYKGIHLNSGEPYIGNHEMFWNSEKFITDSTNEIIAWTELPKYEE